MGPAHGAVNSREMLESLTLVASKQATVPDAVTTGPVIDRECGAHVFEPFFTTKNGSGTGLGLWIVRELLQKNGQKGAPLQPDRLRLLGVLPLSAFNSKSLETRRAKND